MVKLRLHYSKIYIQVLYNQQKTIGVINLKTIRLLTILVSVILILTLVNLSVMINLYDKVGDKVGSTKEVAAKQEAQPSQQAPSAPSIDMSALIDDDAVKGDKDAPVTIIEWSDFECPFCGKFYSQTLGQIEEEYIKTGKVKLVYRDFPLGFHTNAQKAAEAAECAGEQGKYYDMHDKLFEKGVKGGVNSFKQYAEDIGLNTAEFDSCLDSGKMASEVQKDMQDGGAAGIRGTPGFIINGQLISGAQPFSVFKQIIDQELG